MLIQIDDGYEGYRFVKGTTFLANTWYGDNQYIFVYVYLLTHEGRFITTPSVTTIPMSLYRKDLIRMNWVLSQGSKPQMVSAKPMGSGQEEEYVQGLPSRKLFGKTPSSIKILNMGANIWKEINISKLIWAFDILPGNDPITGRQLTHEEVNDSMETQWTNGFLTAPKPFPVKLSLRSEKHGEVINREIKQAQEIFRDYED
jgi:hypothetical protein